MRVITVLISFSLSYSLLARSSTLLDSLIRNCKGYSGNHCSTAPILDDIHELVTRRVKVDNLTLNYLIEIYLTQTNGHTRTLLEIEAKYQDIRHRQAYLPKIQGKSKYDRPHLDYHPYELLQVLKTFRDFGSLNLYLDRIEANSDQFKTYQASQKPWSAYWYPFTDRSMVQGPKSTMSILDRIGRLHNLEMNAQENETDILNLLQGDHWEGLCHAWSLAAILTNEPKERLYIKGETLQIVDQKALRIKLYDRAKANIYGLRFLGDGDGETYQDLRPEAFHRIVDYFLAEREEAFVIDKTAGIEVWQHPVFRVDRKISRDPIERDAYRVQIHVWMIAPQQSPSNAITTLRDEIVKTYDYRLFIDPVANDDGSYRVIAGDWVSRSRKDHPDFVVSPHGVDVKSSNQTLNQHEVFIHRVLGL